MRPVTAGHAPAPVGPYVPAVVAGTLVFCSGQIGLNAQGVLVGGDTAAQTRQALDNLTAIIVAAGSDWGRVVRVEVYLVDLAEFAAFNEIYESYCVKGTYPARVTVGVQALPKGARVEISCIAEL